MKVNGIVSGAARCLVLRVVGVAGLMFTLAACQTGGGSGFAEEGIGYREARFAEITALRGYRSCAEEAQALDVKARETRSPARYLASARLIERCETELGMGGAGLAPEDADAPWQFIIMSAAAISKELVKLSSGFRRHSQSKTFITPMVRLSSTLRGPY